MSAEKDGWRGVAWELGKVEDRLRSSGARRLHLNTKEQLFCISSTFLKGAGMDGIPCFQDIQPAFEENYSGGLVTHTEPEVTEVLPARE